MSDKEMQELYRKAAAGDREAQIKLDRMMTRADIPQTVFVITEVSWEYNDEYYYPGAGSEPIQVFRSAERANEEWERLEHETFISTFSSTALEEYYSNWDSGGDWENFPEDLAEALGFHDENDLMRYTIPDGLSDDLIRRLRQALSISFYSVQAVPFEG